MRTYLFTSIFLMLSLCARAQESPKFYAIDGTEWETKYERDQKENSIWEKIETDVNKAYMDGKLGNNNYDQETKNAETLKRLFGQCRSAVDILRLANSGKEMLQNPEFRYYLSQNGVEVKAGKGINNELFNLQEYLDCFNRLLRECKFNAEIVDEIANLPNTNYDVDFVVSDFDRRLTSIISSMDTELELVKYKEESIYKYYPQYQLAKETLDTLEKVFSQR